MEKSLRTTCFGAALFIALALVSPQRVLAAEGDIFVSDSPLIVRIGADGNRVNLPVAVLGATGVATDQLGNLFIADTVTNSVIKIDAAGTQTTLTTGLNNPQDIITDPSGNVYVANAGDNSVVKISQGGTKNTVATGLSNPQGLALDRLGNLLVSNAGNSSIVKVSTDGTKSTVVSAGLNSPQGIAFDANGNLLIADTAANAIRQLDPNGVLTTLLSTGLNSPQDIIPTNTGDLLIVDTGSGSLLNFDPDTGTITTDQGAFTAPQAAAMDPGVHELLNISTRGFVGTGDSVLIGGFIVRGEVGIGATRTVVRGLGPALSGFGVPNVLANPTIELRDNTGALVASNNNWKDTQQAQIEATNLAPTNDNESAIVADLPDGAYTVILRGEGGTTGNGLVEAYKVQ